MQDDGISVEPAKDLNPLASSMQYIDSDSD